MFKTIGLIVLVFGAFCCEATKVLDDFDLVVKYAYNHSSTKVTKSVYVSKTAKASWSKSIEICKSYDMELVTFDLPSEAAYLLVQYRKFPTRQKNVWVGYTDEQTEGIWKSNQGKYLESNCSFHLGEPTNGEGYGYVENCLEIWYSNNDHKYNDNQCNLDHHFMCQQKTSKSYVDELQLLLEKEQQTLLIFQNKMRTETDTFKVEIYKLQTKVQELETSCGKSESQEMSELKIHVMKLRDDLAVKVIQLAKKDTQIADQSTQLADQNTQLDSKVIQLAKKDSQIADQNTQLDSKNKQLASKNIHLADKYSEIAYKNTEISKLKIHIQNLEIDLADKNKQLAQKDREIADKNREIASKDNQLADHENGTSSKDCDNISTDKQLNKDLKNCNEKNSLLIQENLNLKKLNTSTLICEYEDNGQYYSCITDNFEIINENSNIEVHGTHQVYKTDNDVVEVNIGNSKTKRFSNAIFKHFTNLEKLNIVSSSLSYLTQGVFYGAGRLRKLNIKGNNIKSISYYVFEGAEGLNVLKMENNNIEFLSTEAFKELNNLQTLSLKNNRIKDLPVSIFVDLRNLRYLVISSNELQELDAKILENNKEIRELWFDKNNLSKIESEMFSNCPLIKRAVFTNNNCINMDSQNVCYEIFETQVKNNCTAKVDTLK